MNTNTRKIKLLKVWEILNRETDENNPMSTPKLIERLARYGIAVDRKVLYNDIKILNECGYEIMCHRSTFNEYYVMDRSFDIPEIRILLDAVQAACFVTEKKTEALVGKIAQLAGDKKAEVLKKNRVEFHTPKSDNEQIYYSVDNIGNAIECGKQISFLYFDYDISHHRVYRKSKERYTVNPLATVFSDDNYYLMSNDDYHDGISHYRIDRMEDVRVLDSPITKSEQEYDLAKHKNQLFGMFNGEDAKVSFCADATLIDHIFDKFGFDTEITYGEDKTLLFTADVQVSPTFLGWCCSFGKLLKVTAPRAIAQRVKDYAATVSEQYN